MKFRFEFYVFNYLEDVGIGIFDGVFSGVQYQLVKYGIDFKIK